MKHTLKVYSLLLTVIAVPTLVVQPAVAADKPNIINYVR